MHEIRWAQVTVSKQYREHAFRKPPSTTMDGGWIKGSFDPWQRSLFVPSVSSANTKEKGPLLAGKHSSKLVKQVQQLLAHRFANRLLRELDLGEWMAADHKPLAARRALSKRIVCSYGQLPHRYHGEF